MFPPLPAQIEIDMDKARMFHQDYLGCVEDEVNIAKNVADVQHDDR